MDQLIVSVAEELGVTVAGAPEKRLQALESEVNRLLLHHFDRLVSILYRMDVSEQKLKQLLKTRPDEDAARLIVMLLIERQAEKIRTRSEFRSDPGNINEDERW